MERILSRTEMQAIDRKTIDEFGIPSHVLMEVAGARCADHIMREYPDQVQDGVVVLCGTGNNGGDGYVIARHLFAFCPEILIFSLGTGKMSEESRNNRLLCEKLDIPIFDINSQRDLRGSVLEAIGVIPVLIDAVFGIGFKGDLPPLIHNAFTAFSSMAEVVVAIDIPSGLDADNGNGECMKADLTLAIEELKYGHILQNGCLRCGKLLRIPIGIPEIYKEDTAAYIYNECILPERPANAHKGDFGRVYIFGGSPGYVGSVRLSARSALRSGAGLVHICSRKEVISFYTAACDEVMNFAIPETSKNMPCQKELKELLKRADAICIGSGMGLDEYALHLLSIILKYAECPCVIDADAITLLAQNRDLIPLLKLGNFVLTPHKAEFCRLAGISLQDLDADLIARLNEAQAAWGCAILLKGHSSLYADGDKTLVIRAGNDALATGGSGDLLAGIIASFAAQNLPLYQAVCSAALLMGSTAERLCRKQHSYSVLPGDIIEHLGDKDA
ncbi:MAG: NAD(P)H-hydrate dehydratase [Candidatus Cloacimonetes bacterium]|jgi:NAD(P)H-hydrate epimerase|nr:NAD(P)H-hydrate dehydratase [Candidatus Cloacimonadota bacterium]MDD2505838.1 NAD(P)H-hydrate dehydratase [Candidatus Cloacimonadota bacterium]MDD4147048.1 NAD(P)H-hydrate dehydratase [Candidatus Cloacimonadota bacterium]MDD4559467.1 NAD(P)H-hydrate dehydratase [Candidatus Cloacimonadota bacterium]